MTKTYEQRLRRKLYMVWWHMLDRCYNTEHERYRLYGGAGVQVSDEWKNFEGFLREIGEVIGYSEEGIMNSLLHLDKDVLNKGNKLYSKHTCAFVPKELNNQHKPNQMKEFIGISPEGMEFTSYNQSEFARAHDLAQEGISDCLRKKQLQHKGWKFKYK